MKSLRRRLGLRTHLPALALKEGAVELLAAVLTSTALHALFDGATSEDAWRVRQALEQSVPLFAARGSHFVGLPCTFRQAFLHWLVLVLALHAEARQPPGFPICHPFLALLATRPVL